MSFYCGLMNPICTTINCGQEHHGPMTSNCREHCPGFSWHSPPIAYLQFGCVRSQAWLAVVNRSSWWHHVLQKRVHACLHSPLPQTQALSLSEAESLRDRVQTALPYQQAVPLLCSTNQAGLHQPVWSHDYEIAMFLTEYSIADVTTVDSFPILWVVYLINNHD